MIKHDILGNSYDILGKRIRPYQTIPGAHSTRACSSQDHTGAHSTRACSSHQLNSQLILGGREVLRLNEPRLAARLDLGEATICAEDCDVLTVDNEEASER